MNRKELTESFDLALTGKKEKTKSVYKSIFRGIVNKLGVRDPFDAEGWSKFLQYLENSGKSKSYQKNCYSVYKKLVELTGGSTVKLPDAPDVESRDLTQTAIPEEELSKSLKHLSVFRPKEQICLTLGAFYGFRNVEMSKIEVDDFDSQVIFQAPTAKKGRQKYHWIPDYLRDYLNQKNVSNLQEWLSKYKSKWQALQSNVFYRVFYPLKPDEDKRWGWHTVRRRLVTAFDDQILSWKEEVREEEREELPYEKEDISTFMRWASGEHKMYSRYAQRDEELSKIEDIELDKTIMNHHPFRKFLS